MFHKDKKYGCVASQAEALKLLDVFAHVEARLLMPSLRVLPKSGADAEQWCGLKMVWSLCTVAKMVMCERLDNSDLVEMGICHLALGRDAARVVTNAECGM